MKHNILKLLLTMGLIALSLPAVAERMTSVETAYELKATNVAVLASGKHGTVAFSPCEDCAQSRLELAADTVFRINRKVVSRQAFRRAVGISNGDVYLFVSNESGRVARMELDG